MHCSLTLAMMLLPFRLAAYEVQPATLAVALRAFGKLDPTLSPQAAYERMASGATNAFKV